MKPTGGVGNHRPEDKATAYNNLMEQILSNENMRLAWKRVKANKGEPTSNVITTVITEEATGSDKSAIAKVEKAMENSAREFPSELYVDAGYTSAAEIARFEHEGRELKGAVQPAPTCGKRYKVDEFEIDILNRSAVCPAGKKNSQCSRLEEKKTGRVDFRFEWGKPVESVPCGNTVSRRVNGIARCVSVNIIFIFKHVEKK